MILTISIWLVAAAFFGAGVFNAIGTQKAKSGFARWGYPRWWNIPTGGLEILSAVLIALPASRIVGLGLGAVIIAAAVVTVLRHREFSHLAPLGVFAGLIAIAATLSYRVVVLPHVTLLPDASPRMLPAHHC